MRKLKAPFLAVTIILFNVSVVLAAPEPPEPTVSTAQSDACEFCDPGTPPVPIDQNIVFLAISGLALGAGVIYKNKIKKASI
ncbi:hypothetical protein HNP37_001233 [Flavobacterium nitrogenifigens]|uniref:PEP-CTERM protein-sorting domain-containing protein n=2 Tax=Flavobacterium TaxID=237 RepID=A0A7W7IV82_9FLAO|nr:MULTISPECIES: hypothetical protein [Flavobacterium]MBB4801194.1 hypothetical protein [Flavobacterium nitrogenifigens]MBB6385058.1 hypothetical protein [Flavobacterium notoginsengisoli]